MDIFSGSFFILLFGISDCLTAYGVCQDAFTGTDMCCSDFELVNSKCVPCQIGYTSTGGKSCTVCPESFYGYNCAKACKCDKDQRCDNVVGCVNITKPTILPTMFSTGVTHISPTTDLNEGPTTKQTNEMSIGTIIPLYSLSVGGLIIFILLCHVVIEHRHTRANAVQLHKDTQLETYHPAGNRCIEV